MSQLAMDTAISAADSWSSGLVTVLELDVMIADDDWLMGWSLVLPVTIYSTTPSKRIFIPTAT